MLTLVKQKSDVSADVTEGNEALPLLEEDKILQELCPALTLVIEEEDFYHYHHWTKITSTKLWLSYC